MNDFSFVLEALLFSAAVFGLIRLARRSKPAPSAAPAPAPATATATAPTPPRNTVVAHPPAQPSGQTRAEFERRTVAELQELARAQGLTGLSRLRKAELIDQLLALAGRG